MAGPAAGRTPSTGGRARADAGGCVGSHGRVRTALVPTSSCTQRRCRPLQAMHVAAAWEVQLAPTLCVLLASKASF